MVENIFSTRLFDDREALENAVSYLNGEVKDLRRSVAAMILSSENSSISIPDNIKEMVGDDFTLFCSYDVYKRETTYRIKYKNPKK